MSAFKRFACAAALLPLMACASAEFRPRAIANAFEMRGDADAALAQARFNFDAGNYALAISGFRNALRREPANAEAYIGLSQSYDRLGRFDLAQRYYQEGLALSPDDPNLRRSYAAALRARNMEAQARAIEESRQARAENAEPTPSMASASITIELPDLPVEPPALPASEPVPRLERLSRGEVALVTVERPAAPVRHAPARAAEAASAQRLPARLVRGERQQLVFDFAPAPAAAPPSPRQANADIRVLNAVGRRGQAGRMGQHVRALGWDRVSVGDASVRRLQSRIVGTPGSAGEARRLSESLPFRPPVILSANARHLFLVLGRDALPFDDRLRADVNGS
jgi:tetratricopeptide (TPR) repeat protein